MKPRNRRVRAVRWRRLLVVGVLALLGAALALAYLRARYSLGHFFDVLWGVGVRLSRERVAAALVVSAVVVWLAARWRSGRRNAYPVLLAYGCGVVADALVLVALELLGISYGPVLLPLVIAAAGRSGVVLVLTALAWLAGSAIRRSRRWPWVHVGAQALILAVVVYGFAIEPARLTLSTVHVPDPYHGTGRPLRIVQLTDLHIERATRLNWRVVEATNALQPDLIVLTGDYLNTSFLGQPQARADFRRLIGALRARHGIYAVRGSVDTPSLTRELLAGLPVTLLEDRWVTLEVDGRRLVIAGVAMRWDLDEDRQALAQLLPTMPRGCFSALLYHSPELVPEVAQAGFNLCPTGHTHGGQVRLPLYGAITTFSIYGKRYEMGLYREGDTLAYVARGIGMEGWLMPRMRFLCPPEIVCYEVD